MKMTTAERNIVVKNNPSRDQLEKIYDILDECFSVGRAFFQERLDLDSTYDPNTTWFATVDGTIASNVQIFPLHIRVGKSVLKVGAMGSVGTHPDYRGMGLAHKILSAETEYMKQEQYDISLLLASKHGFYEKAGWRLIPEMFYSMDKPSDLTKQTDCEIMPFEEQYLDDLAHIYEQFNTDRTYTLVRNKTYWNDMITWPEWKRSHCLLVRVNNEVVAYGIIEKKDAEQVFICEMQYLPQGEEYVVDLFHALCEAVPNAKQIYAMLPEDHKLYSYYEENQAKHMPIHIAMWKFINFDSTFNKLQPQLEARIQANSQYEHQSLHIELQCEEHQLFLDYENGKLSLSNESKAASKPITITVEERDLIAYMMFGYKPNEVANPSLSDEQEDILNLLFPKQHSVFYLTDRF